MEKKRRKPVEESKATDIYIYIYIERERERVKEDIDHNLKEIK